MTVVDLAVEPRDVAAEALGLLLDAPAPATLAELRIDDAQGDSLVLGVLAASHVVTATRAGRQLTEQVSCDALGSGGCALPQSVERDGYRLTSDVRVLPRVGVEALADQLRAQAVQPGWICGTFPGADAAVTALTGAPLDGGGWSWRTWHLYPGESTGVVVETATTWRP